MADNRVSIIGFKNRYDSVSGTLNNREIADKISGHFGDLSTFFAKPNLIFAPVSGWTGVNYPDPDGMMINMNLYMDPIPPATNGKQFQLMVLIKRTISDVTGVVSGA